MDNGGSILPPESQEPERDAAPGQHEQSQPESVGQSDVIDARSDSGGDADSQPAKMHDIPPESPAVNAQSVRDTDDTALVPPDASADSDDTLPAVPEDDWLAGMPTVPYRYPSTPRPRAVPAYSSRARKHRHYILYLRKQSRGRRLAQSRTLVKVVWASAAVAVLLLVAVVASAASAAASYYQSQQTAVASLSKTVASKDSVRIYDSTGKLLYEFKDLGAQHSISIAQIPVTVVNATVAIEDHTFWTNNGVDFISIVRAAQADLASHRTAQGGSTITQQLIKQNILNSSDTFSRKIREAIISIGITTQGTYSKQQILQMYLDSIPYGNEAYGIDAAAQKYFGYQDNPVTGESAAQHLDLAQASLLAGVPQNPNLNDPLAHFQTAHERQKAVLADMVLYGYITQQQANAAYAEAAQPNFFNVQYDNTNLAPQFVTYVQNQLSQMVETGQIHLSRSGLNVYTTLDLDLQNHAQQAMNNHLHGNDTDDYGHGLIRNDHITNAAEVMADQHTGAIKVLLGSTDYYSTSIDGKFDVATQGYRGPGSSFKPIVYATAFEKGWFPAMTISDTPTVFWDAGSGQQYKPLDFDRGKFLGEVTIRSALQNSLNIPAIKAMQYAGFSDVQAQAERMGITDVKGTYGLSTVLGTLNVTPMEMAQAYTVFANYGQYIPLHAIDKITDSAGDVLYQYRVPTPIQVMTPQIAFLMTNILEDNKSRAGDFGPCSPLYLDPDLNGDCYYWKARQDSNTAGSFPTWPSPNAWPAAVKTGTGQDFTDDWTCGYTMDYTTVVWAGNNDYTPMYHIDGVTGAAPIWYNSMIYAEQRDNHAKQQFPVPAGVHPATYTSNGVTSTDWFLDGPAPQSNIGSGPTTVPCITLHSFTDPNPWDYCSGGGATTPGAPNPANPNG